MKTALKHIGIGTLSATLLLLMIFNSMGVFDERANDISLVPITKAGEIRAQEATVTPTPTPTLTPTPEELHDRRFEFDNRHKINPWHGGDADELPIETGRKKKKQRQDGHDESGRLTDLNGDGVLEFSLIALDRTYYLDGKLMPTFITRFSHSCCQCKLTHDVDVVVELSMLGLVTIRQRWTVDEETTRELRRKDLRFRQQRFRFFDDHWPDPYEGRPDEQRY